MNHRSHPLPPALLLLCSLFAACSPTIDLPQGSELKVKQIDDGPAPRVELSWKLIVRVDGYLLHYDLGGSAGPPFAGKGLAVVPWPEGCGDMDAGAAELGADAMSTSSTDQGLTDGQAADGKGADAAEPEAGPPDQGPPDLGSPDSAPGKEAGTPDAAIPDTSQADTGAPAPGVDSPINIPVSWCLDREDTFKDAGKIPVHTPGTRPRVRLQNLELGRTYRFAVQGFRRAGVGPMSQTVSISIKDKIK